MWVILCCLPEKGRKQIEEIAEEVKERDRVERGTDFLLLYWGLTTHQPLWVILCHLLEKGRKEKEEIVEEMKERNRVERGVGVKWKKQNK